MLPSALSSALWFLMAGGSAVSFPAGTELRKGVDFQQRFSASWRGGELEEKDDWDFFSWMLRGAGMPWKTPGEAIQTVAVTDVACLRVSIAPEAVTARSWPQRLGIPQ